MCGIKFFFEQGLDRQWTTCFALIRRAREKRLLPKSSYANPGIDNDSFISQLFFHR